jgi:hypothetical protein
MAGGETSHGRGHSSYLGVMVLLSERVARRSVDAMSALFYQATVRPH